MERHQIGIIIPAYNEATTIGSVVFGASKLGVAIVVDDDLLRWAVVVVRGVIGSRRKICVESAVFFNGYAFPMVTYVAQ